ncbi:MAG: PspA/IM30 family protein [Anaerolineae bacterium]|nr:PspA/IM30 family protein [Anaerolineae bacterium]
MASLIEKVQTLISANLHAMVDQALEANSVKVMDEYIRQAERNLDALEDAAATVGGTVRTLERKYKEYAAAVEKLDRDIDTLLVKGKTELATAAQADLNSKQQMAQEYYEQWQQQKKEYERLFDSRRKLQTKLNTIRDEREQLKALMELAEAKRTTVQAIRSLDDLKGIGDQDIARIGDAIRARLDEEEARLEMHTTGLEDELEEAIGDSVLQEQLAERRRRLGLEE